MKLLFCLFALALPASAAISISLPGSTETATWALTSSTYAGFNSFGTAANAWAGPAAGSGSASAMFNKVSGSGYIGSSFMYTAGTNGGFRVYDDTPIASLETLVFQGKISDVFTTIPILNFNGGSQALAADFSAVVTGGGYPDRAWQWDLSGIAGPITSYEILFDGHFAATSLQLDAGNSFVQVIPEPSVGVLGIAALGLTFIRRRRA